MIFSSHKNICACKKSAPFDPVWPYLAPCGPIWPRLPRLALFDPVWPHLVQFGPVWSRFVPFCPICPHLLRMAPLGHFLISISKYFKVPIRQGELSLAQLSPGLLLVLCYLVTAILSGAFYLVIII